MDELSQERRNAIIDALQRGVTPKLLPSHRYAMQLTPGRRGHYVTLVDGQGPTPEGEFVYHTLGLDVPTDLNFDQFTEPTRRGDNEYVKKLNGQEVRIRYLSPNGRNWKYTSAGDQWALTKRAEVLVRIPVTIHGENADDGHAYNRGEQFYTVKWPTVQGLDAIALNATLTDAQKNHFIKDEVKQQLGLVDASSLVDHSSNEDKMYDPTREHHWLISYQINQPGAHGPRTSLVLNQPMGVLHNTSIIPHVQSVLPVCFEKHDDHLCVARALGALLEVPMEQIAANFDYTFGRKWRRLGLTSNQLFEWCRLEGRNAWCTHMGDMGRWNIIVQKDEKNTERAVSWAIAEGHIYMYKDAHLLASDENQGFAESTSFKVQMEMEPRIKGDFSKETNTRVPDVRTWQLWAGEVSHAAGEIRPGYFYVHYELADVRMELCRRGRSPKVTWGGEQYSQIVVECVEALDGQTGTCVIKKLPPEMDKILAWLDRIEELTGHRIIWQGEGLPNLCYQVFRLLLKGTRQNLTPRQKRTIFEAQNGLCAICKEAPVMEYDHITPVRASFRGEAQTFQGLCLACHGDCTKFQSDSIGLESSLSPFACRAYRDSPKHPGLVHIVHTAQSEAHKKHMKLLDIVRCRYSAAAHYDLASFPRFCVLDNIEPFDITRPNLGDLNFIDPPAHKNLYLDELPMTGPLWYSELEARHALSHGIIQWSDVKATYKATGRIPRDSVEAVLALMEAAWGKENQLAKDSWNSALGIMGGDFLERYHLVTSTTQLPALGSRFKKVLFEMNGEDVTLYDHITPIPLVSCQSTRPFWDMILGWEYTKVSALCYAIQRMMEPRNILQIQTDSVLIANTKRKADELNSIAEMTYEDVCHLSNPQGLQKFKKRAVGADYPIRQGDTGKIFQEKKPKEMKGQRHEIRRNATLLTLSKVWRDIPAPVENGRINTDAACRHVLNGHNIWIDGMGGAGKTTLGQQIVQELRSMKKTVSIIAKTHSACRRFGGDGVETADKWLNKYVGKACGPLPDVVFIEEISMIDLRLWGFISTLFQTRKCQIVLSGDLFQLKPPKNTWNGSDVPRHAFRDSDLLYELADGNRCFLDANMRSDPVIFEFAKTLRQPGACLQERLAEAREKFPPTKRIPDHVLVMSHSKRVDYNGQYNALKKPVDAMFLEKPTVKCRDDCEPQSMWIWPGMKLMGQKTAKSKGAKQKPYCVKSMMYEVVSCDKRIITVKSADGDVSAIPTASACDLLRLCDALTYARAQGLTLSGLIVLADTTKDHFEMEHLNMGVTRAAHSSLVEIRDL